jgi:hypothetical protein
MYQPIPPHAITAADKHIFYAVGMGDLQVEVPNGNTSTTMLLRDALHTPDMGITIISVSHIAKAGYSVFFKGNSCKIQNPSGDTIGDIPASVNGLYKVDHVCMAADPIERVELATLHQQLSHIAPDTIRTLIRNSAVEGVQLINDSAPLICDACEQAKLMHKPI